MNAKTYSALQKTYDQSHLTCSTAVYYESQGNNFEALRCWRKCLAQLQGHNFGGYRPRTETEKALLLSLKKMQDQCQDRVDLLQAILASNIEAESSSPGWRNPGDGRAMAGPVTTTTNFDAHPMVSITPPLPPERLSTTSSSMSALPQLAAYDFLHTRPSTLSRTSSLETRAFLSTLRPIGKQKKGEQAFKVDIAAAAKAATLAWGSLSLAEGSAIARAPIVPLENLSSTRPNVATSASTSDLSDSPRLFSPTTNRQPSPPNTFQTRPDLSDLKPRPQSLIFPLGNPSHTPFEARPPMPPPHRNSESASPKAIGAPHNMRVLDPYSEPDLSSPIPHLVSRKVRPTPPRKAPPKPATMPSRLYPLSLLEPGQPVPGATSRSSSNTEDSRNPTLQGDHTEGIEPQSSSIDQIHNHHTAQGQHHGDHAGSSSMGGISHCGIHVGGNDRVAKALETISKGVDMQAALQVANEIVVQGDDVCWDDIAGLDAAKLALKEAVVYPFLRPDLFSGLREPARGMLLFGPPGTGKTMLARAVATESESTFFSISASSLTSKYLGESEKLVRALFALAKALSPSIIFVDEIDSLLSSRSGSGENEASRRIKTEFLIQWSDLAKAAAGKEGTTGDDSRVLVLAATNLPWAIDDAARRRFVRRQYIPLPGGLTREKHLLRLLSHQRYELCQEEIGHLVDLTEGFSGSDITALAKDAAMGPLRSLGEALLQMKKDDIRPITLADFKASLSSIRPSVSKEGLQEFEDWAKRYGERV